VKRIFQIGFNKAGTVSIHYFFTENGISSVHWDRGNISKTIHNNYLTGKPLLEGLEEYQAFTDMEHTLEGGGFIYSAERYFKELDQAYPESLFILNFRDMESWIRSRLNHKDYLFDTMLQNALTKNEAIELWREEYKKHIDNVLSYFGDRENLLVLEIKEGNEHLLGDFLERHGIPIKNKTLGHRHKTELKKRKRNIKSDAAYINDIRNAAIHFETDDISLALQLMKVAEKLRPEGNRIRNRINKYESYLAKRKIT